MDDSLKRRCLCEPDPEKNTREYICPAILPTAAGAAAPHGSEDRLKTIFLIDNNGREAVKCAQTDSNQAEDICPARFFAVSGPANHRINVAGKKKGRTNAHFQKRSRRASRIFGDLARDVAQLSATVTSGTDRARDPSDTAI
jgi:hypothetical protein